MALFALAHRGRNFVAQGIRSKEFYLSSVDFQKLNDDFFHEELKKQRYWFFYIGYNFAQQLLLQNYTDEPDFYLAPLKTIDDENVLIRSFDCVSPWCLSEDFSTYQKKIQSIQEQMNCGNVYLLNYTQQASSEINIKEYEIQRSGLQRLPLGAQGCYIELPDATILSFSPESFVTINRNRITTRPIKGTLPLSSQPKLLLNSVKENAESTMVVDLMRNDIGMISDYGSVAVKHFQKIKRQHQLWQMYSTIEGRIKRGWKFPQDIIKLLPAGSISGTPKHSAVSIIQSHEGLQRKQYCGLVGIYDQQKHRLFSNIVIRATIFSNTFSNISSKNKIASVGVGGGITIDSDIDAEYRECQWKLNSVDLALQNFNRYLVEIGVEKSI